METGKRKYTRHKVSEKQRKELIVLWLENKMHEVKRIQRELGVDAKYTAKWAAALGLKKRNGHSHHDPRWKWAIERGAINR